MRPTFTPIDNRKVSHDTVRCLREALELAERGELFGAVVISMLKQRKYAMHVTGEAHRNPTFTRGMLCVLDDQLARQISG